MNLFFFRISAILFFAYSLAPAQQSGNIYEVIRKSFPIASPLVIILIGSSIILVLGCIVAWEVFKSDKQKRDKIELSWKNFAEYSKSRNLKPSEIELLKQLIKIGEMAQADIVFQAPNIYEELLDQFIQKSRDYGNGEAIPYDQLYNLRQKLGYSRIPMETPLTSTRQLNPGAQVTLKTPSKDYLKCTVKNVDEKSWSLASKQGSFSSFDINMPINVWHIRNGDAEYRITTDVLNGQSDSLVLDHSMNFNRKQLRNWVRVDVNLPCKATLIDFPEDNDSPYLKKGAHYEGRITDISGGGLCMRLKAPIEGGFGMTVTFDLPGSSLRGLLTEVLSTSPLTDDEEIMVCRLKFKNIDTALQEKIVRFVFEKSRIDSQFR